MEQMIVSVSLPFQSILPIPGRIKVEHELIMICFHCLETQDLSVQRSQP